MTSTAEPVTADEAVTGASYATCGAKTRAGGACQRPSGWGTDHAGYGRCKLHGGSTVNGRKQGQRLRLSAVQPEPIGGFDAIERSLGILNGLMSAVKAELDRDDEHVLDGEQLHATLRLARDAARDLATVGKLAADVGLDERRLQLETAKLSLVAATLRAVFADPELDLTGAQQELAVRVTARHLRELEAGS